MTTKRRDLSIIIAFGIILGTLVASQARAEIRVNARVRVPGGVIQIDNGVHRHHVGRPTVIRELNRQDRKIARRLARYTGVAKRDILRLRRVGYRWNEIGRWLELSRRTMQAAKHADTWARFMKRQKRLSRYRLPAHLEPNQRRDIDGCIHRW